MNLFPQSTVENLPGEQRDIEQTPFLEAAQANLSQAWHDGPLQKIITLDKLAGDEIYGNSPTLSKEEATLKYGMGGDLKFDGAIKEDSAIWLRDNKMKQLERDRAIANASNSWMQASANFGASLLGTVADPLNIAVSFIPVLGEENLARIGFGAARSAFVNRVVKGAVDATVGQALVEPIVYYGAKSEQENYTFEDSLKNLALAPLLGAGLHTGFGAIGDAWSLFRAKDLSFKKWQDASFSVIKNNTTPDTQAAMTKAALSQLTEKDAQITPEQVGNTDYHVVKSEMDAQVIEAHDKAALSSHIGSNLGKDGAVPLQAKTPTMESFHGQLDASVDKVSLQMEAHGHGLPFEDSPAQTYTNISEALDSVKGVYESIKSDRSLIYLQKQNYTEALDNFIVQAKNFAANLGHRDLGNKAWDIQRNNRELGLQFPKKADVNSEIRRRVKAVADNATKKIEPIKPTAVESKTSVDTTAPDHFEKAKALIQEDIDNLNKEVTKAYTPEEKTAYEEEIKERTKALSDIKTREKGFAAAVSCVLSNVV